MRRPLVAFGFAAIAAGLAATPAEAISIHVPCPECDSWPLWAQVLVPIVGVSLAMAVLYVPYRLSRRAQTPRRRALILIGGVVVLIVALVVLARLLVVLVPG